MTADTETYVDGFVAAVPKRNKAIYLKIAQDAAEIFREHGALQVVETWGDEVPDGEITSFPMAVKAKADEVVVFSWIIWPSKEAREKGNAAVMADPRMVMPDGGPFFDSKRMIFGSFRVMVQE